MNDTTNFDQSANDEALVRECLDAVGQEAFSRLLDGIANISMERDMALSEIERYREALKDIAGLSSMENTYQEAVLIARATLGGGKR